MENVVTTDEIEIPLPAHSNFYGILGYSQGKLAILTDIEKFNLLLGGVPPIDNNTYKLIVSNGLLQWALDN